MAAPTVSEFLALFPAFIEEPASRIQSALDFSTLLLDSGTWGDFYHRAVALDAAHSLAMSIPAQTGVSAATEGTAGTVSSVSGAGVSISFNAPPAFWSEGNNAYWYSKTIYGQQLLRLQDLVLGGARMTI